jgi:hypothetical protein
MLEENAGTPDLKTKLQSQMDAAWLPAPVALIGQGTWV